MQVRALQGDTVDSLCWRHLGQSSGVVEQTLALNRGLAAGGPLLQEGQLVTLPEPTTDQRQDTSVKLWD